jgi:hypothetical protein
MQVNFQMKEESFNRMTVLMASITTPTKLNHSKISVKELWLLMI